MFLRRKPPQLLPLEELQQAYNDCCNLSVQNLTLEEENRLEQALRGWKSLHTLMLYKTDLFERQADRYDEEERRILQELKDIRDQNVKHLIRVQLRLDEIDRKAKRNPDSGGLSTTRAAAATSGAGAANGAANGSSMSVPSLRSSSGAPLSRSLLSSTQQRQMLKSLRPGVPTTRTNESAAKAASVSWRQPPPKPRAPQPYPLQRLPSPFADFDQHYERSGRSTPDLIDLDDLRGIAISAKPTHSMENLTHERLGVPPPPPPPQRRAAATAQAPLASGLPQGSPKPSLAAVSKSTPDVREETKRYVYTKPKPLNVSGMMRAQAKKKAAAAAGAGNSAAATPRPANAAARKPGAKVAPAAPAATPAPAPAPPAAQSATTPAPYKSTTVPKLYVKKPAAKAKPLAAKPELPMASPSIDDASDAGENGVAGPADAAAEEDYMSSEQSEQLILSIRGIDLDAARQILNDIVVHGDEVHWSDIAGLESAKNSLKEAVVYPFLRPDLFSGLREPARGLLLFGPPGTGKTMLARAVATELHSTFFSISASLLTSKYLGESEKLVKALFLLARKLSPLIVFVDEIDSLLSTRTDGEVDSSRRIKNEFLIQWSELSSAAAGKAEGGDDDAGDVSRVLILGATNVPWAIDEAARRRFVRRQYIPLPEAETRKVHLQHLMSHQKHTLTPEDFEALVSMTNGFSGLDVTALAKDAAMGPLRSLGDLILATPRDQIRPVSLEDFKASLQYIRPSVLADGLTQHEEWAALYGSYGG
jgi:SpoVK/Ycf46/Vps4 family AAA+-type ATPase